MASNAKFIETSGPVYFQFLELGLKNGTNTFIWSIVTADYTEWCMSWNITIDLQPDRRDFVMQTKLQQSVDRYKYTILCLVM